MMAKKEMFVPGQNKIFLDKLIKIRREIHQYPELGNEEFRTTKFVEQILHSVSIPTRRLTKTGTAGLLSGEKRNCLAFRADIDALPVQEATGKSFASRAAGKMHACGHDGNTTMVLGAALLLSAQRKNLSGAVKFIFQPNEETADGAKNLLKAGVFKNPAVSAIIGVHLHPDLPCGKIGLRRGEMMAAVDKFTITILGEGGHGAAPHRGKDAVVIAAQVVNALQSIVSRQLDQVEPALITVGTIHGGRRFNVLADRVELVGTVRTLNEKLHQQIPRLMRQTIAGVCRSWQANFKFDYQVLGYPLVNTEKMVSFVEGVAREYLGKANVVEVKKPSLGGEDFAEYLREAPGCFIYIGGKKPGGGKAYPWHHPKFDFDERALVCGARLLCELALEYNRRERSRPFPTT
ncbi:MAG: M20 family metallopeptidase [Elusimicrobiota bacterium]